jgi:peptide/nickel transport system substrate-binding protein
MDLLVFDQRRAAYSDTAASRYSVPWLNLVLDRDARLLRRVLVDLQNEETAPEAVMRLPGQESLISSEDAAARFEAALDWFDERNHFVISNGPYLLQRYDSAAQFAELQAFRDEAYPFKPGDHAFGQPELVEVSDVEAGSLVPGEPFEARISLSGPGQPGLRYLLLDTATRQVVQQGEADASEGGFTVRLPAETTTGLEGGLYQLVLAGYSDQLSQITERSVELQAGLPLPEESPAESTAVASPGPSTPEPAEVALESDASEEVAAAEPQPEAEQPSAPEPAPVEAQAGPSGGAIAGAGAAVVILGLGAALLLRRRRG